MQFFFIRDTSHTSRGASDVVKHWSCSADSTVAERIRERSLLLVYSCRSSNNNERSRIRSATVESAERDHYRALARADRNYISNQHSNKHSNARKFLLVDKSTHDLVTYLENTCSNNFRKLSD